MDIHRSGFSYAILLLLILSKDILIKAENGAAGTKHVQYSTSGFGF